VQACDPVHLLIHNFKPVVPISPRGRNVDQIPMHPAERSSDFAQGVPSDQVKLHYLERDLFVQLGTSLPLFHKHVSGLDVLTRLAGSPREVIQSILAW
jgi:hypothetical protein